LPGSAYTQGQASTDSTGRNAGRANRALPDAPWLSGARCRE